MTSDYQLPPDGEVPTLKKTALPAEFIFHTGRIVRALAELEDCLDVYISLCANLNASKRIAIVGRSSLNRKIEIGKSLSKLNADPKVLGSFNSVFNEDTKAIIRRRDVLCHGVHLGSSDDGEHAFMTMHGQTPDGEGGLSTKVYLFTEEQAIVWAEYAENLIFTAEAMLGIEALRREWREPNRDLSTRPKGDTR